MKGTAIRDALKVRGHSFTEIAQLLGLSCMQVCRVAHRSRTNHRVALAIAAALDKPIATVFPDVPAYHEPYQPAEERRRSLVQALQAKNLIENRAGAGS